MKKRIIIELVILICFLSCKTNINIPTTFNTTPSMEKFDIKTFNENKDPSSEWYIVTEDIKIKRLYRHYENTYTEIKTYEKEFYSDFKNFYANGNIKYRGKCYDNNKSFFEVGVWEYYDIEGNLIKTVDEDAKYKMNYREAFKIAKEHRFYPENVSVFYQTGSWYFENVKGDERKLGKEK